MASNGVVSFRAGRGPSFILVGLVLIVIILFYSYWGVSSKNDKLLRDVSVLQDRLRVLAARKLTADKKGSALLTQITQMQDDSARTLTTKDGKIRATEERLQEKDAELRSLQVQEKVYLGELEKLKSEINRTSGSFNSIKDKAAEVIKKYETMKVNVSALQLTITKLRSEKQSCQQELESAKLELEKAKQTPAVEVKPPAVSDESKKEVADESKKEAAEDSNAKDSEIENKEGKKEGEESTDKPPMPASKDAAKDSLEQEITVPNAGGVNKGIRKQAAESISAANVSPVQSNTASASASAASAGASRVSEAVVERSAPGIPSRTSRATVPDKLTKRNENDEHNREVVASKTEDEEQGHEEEDDDAEDDSLGQQDKEGEDAGDAPEDGFSKDKGARLVNAPGGNPLKDALFPQRDIPIKDHIRLPEFHDVHVPRVSRRDDDDDRDDGHSFEV